MAVLAFKVAVKDIDNTKNVYFQALEYALNVQKECDYGHLNALVVSKPFCGEYQVMASFLSDDEDEG